MCGKRKCFIFGPGNLRRPDTFKLFAMVPMSCMLWIFEPLPARTKHCIGRHHKICPCSMNKQCATKGTKHNDFQFHLMWFVHVFLLVTSLIGFSWIRFKPTDGYLKTMKNTAISQFECNNWLTASQLRLFETVVSPGRFSTP